MIRMDYENTRANARKLYMVSNTCAGVRKNVENATGNMQSFWRGEAAAAFLHSMEEWGRETGNIERQLDALAGQIIRVANEFEQTERALAAAAKAAEAKKSSDSGGNGGGRF